MRALSIAIASTVASLVLVACPAQPDQNGAAIEAAARALLTGYTDAQTGDQAKAAIELFGTPSFVAKLKAVADVCRANKQSGQQLGPECTRDPIVCGDEPAPISGFKLGAISGSSATVDATIAHATPATASLTLTKTGESWKVDNIACK